MSASHAQGKLHLLRPTVGGVTAAFQRAAAVCQVGNLVVPTCKSILATTYLANIIRHARGVRVIDVVSIGAVHCLAGSISPCQFVIATALVSSLALARVTDVGYVVWGITQACNGVSAACRQLGNLSL